MNWKARVPALAAALWWGSLSAIGFMAVPLLFSHAGSPAEAGRLAAELFGGQVWLSLACGLFILVGARDEDGTPQLGWAGGALAYVLLGVLMALLQEFALAPRIVARQNLAMWHSLGTVVYAVQWLCALVVLWKVTGMRPSSEEGGNPGPLD